MSELLQFQTAADEEHDQRYGAQYERSIKRNAFSVLAEKLMETKVVTETILDPTAKNAPDYVRLGMKRYYRFSVLVGDKGEAQAVVDAEARGRRQALDALKSLLKRPNDYEGEIRGYLVRYLDSVTPEALEFEVARNATNIE